MASMSLYFLLGTRSSNIVMGDEENLWAQAHIWNQREVTQIVSIDNAHAYSLLWRMRQRISSKVDYCIQTFAKISILKTSVMQDNHWGLLPKNKDWSSTNGSRWMMTNILILVNIIKRSMVIITPKMYQ